MQEAHITSKQINPQPAVQAARRLAAVVGRSSEFRRFEENYLQLRQDKEAQRLLQEFQQEQRNYQMKLSWGGANEEDLQRLQKKEKEVFSNLVLKNYFESQENLVSLLKELNVFISEQIGIDFAGTAKPAGGCC